MSILAHGLRAAAGNIGGGGLTLVDTYGFSDAGDPSLPISIPVEENDLVLFLHADASTSAGSLSISVSTTTLATTSNEQNATRLTYFVATSAGSISMNSGSVDGGIAMVFRGADVSLAPQETAANSASGDANPASITATINPADYIAVLVGFDRNVLISGYPSGYSVQYSSQDDIAVAAVTKTGISASSENPSTFSNTSDGWGVYTIHVKAAT